MVDDKLTFRILCLGHGQSASASLLLVHGNHFYIFDPHSHDKNGKPIPSGTSVLLHYPSVEYCCAYLQEMAYTMHCSQYDLTKIEVISSFTRGIESGHLHNDTHKKIGSLPK